MVLKDLAKRVIGRLFRRKRFESKVVISTSKYRLSPSIDSRKLLGSIEPEYSFLSHHHSFDDWQCLAREHLRSLLGLPSHESIEQVVCAEALWKAEDSLGLYEKLMLHTDQSRYFPVYLATPKCSRVPKLWLVVLQGHTSGMHVSIATDRSETYRLLGPHASRDYGVHALRAGYGILCIENHSLGERREQSISKIAPHPCFDASMHGLLLGFSLMGQRVSDVELAVNFFRGQTNADAKWGAIGNSLGGSISLYAAAASEALDYCLPSCCISDFESSLLSIYHCSDLYVPGLARSFRMSDIVGLVAPRPTVVANGLLDSIFPIKGFRKTYLEAKEIYREAGAVDNLKAIIGVGGHQSYPVEHLAALQTLIR